ncbi:bacillithiol system redox-active protein YtxJ [Maribacter hydrothermalis]|uniref:Cytosolic protein n=1 Tax=Maribacter hydrothermalis TaxID=1836467 RepID=A0A1B7Z809_9FLAO|nr:bacillithiol system redox-active protein YtxJ [Maribacter hydrothermalis]APQ19142.1 cytosolic protein [Maribacter hydrothermalis]OBR38847.1 cytosolic protein [Maribacter hydrothermalis]
MGLFGGIFGGAKNDKGKEDNSIPWRPLTSAEQFEEIKKDSITRAQVIFKHSTSCGISRMVLNMFKSSYSLENGQMDFYFLDLLANRGVSNAVASEFGVMHQSPQLLIIKNGVVVMHDSHGAISDIELEQYV